ncbi:hypothetical protein C1708_09250 [Streptomyces sp. DH-12]|nr:hypothetical protein C1708_09250 [Streptomyces sp. DH-12]
MDAGAGGAGFEAVGKDVTVSWACTEDVPDAARSCTVGAGHGEAPPATTVSPGPPEAGARSPGSAQGSDAGVPASRVSAAARPVSVVRASTSEPSWGATCGAPPSAGAGHTSGADEPDGGVPSPVRSRAPGAGASSDMRCDPFLGRTVMVRPAPVPRAPGLR